VLESVFWDKDGILLVNYLKKGATITAKSYVALRNNLKQQLISKNSGKFSRRILFLQDNASLHEAAIKHQILADLDFEFLNPPPTHLICPPWITISFLTSRNTMWEPSTGTSHRLPKPVSRKQLDNRVTNNRNSTGNVTSRFYIWSALTQQQKYT
jgi:hypothetical protein